MRRIVLATTIGAAFVPSAGASAATLVPDQGCYVEHGAVTLHGSGFGALDLVNLSGPQVFESGNADANGGFTVTSPAPLLGTIAPGSKSFTLAATDQTTQVTASTTINVATATFATSGGVASATAKRTWTFSGLFQRPGKPIYGHFRFGGKTRSTYRFGVPKGACGELKAKAPLIPGASPTSGKWRVQIDFEKRYSPTAKPRLSNTATVFRSFR